MNKKIMPHRQTGTEEQAKAAWEEFVKNNELPDGFPSNPDEIYKDKWKGWIDFLGWANPNNN